MQVFGKKSSESIRNTVYYPFKRFIVMQQLSFTLLLACGLLTACGDTASNATTADTGTDAPIEAMDGQQGDWIDLFDGETLAGWHTYGKQGQMGAAWMVEDGTLHFNPDKGTGADNNGGDIITDDSYSNYELQLEWKIGECGNSGIIYNVKESEEFGYPWMTGPEMQILDNDCHPDAKITTHRAGDLYDMVSVEEENVRPAGEWNQAKLVVTDGRVEHWLNGKQQVTYENTGEGWQSMIAKSKFKDMPTWGMYTEGRISLQDHGDPVWFRNIRLRKLSK